MLYLSYDSRDVDIVVVTFNIDENSVLDTTPTPTETTTPSPTPQPTEAPFFVLAPSTLMSFEELVGDNGDYVAYEDIPTLPPNDSYKLVVNIYYQFITIYKKDESGDFTIPVRYILCTTGKASTPTPIGEFEIGEKRARFSEFSSLDCFAQYWVQLTDDYYFHSILYKKRDARYYSAKSYRDLGTRVSHGCIRMSVPDARWIWYNIAPGTKVEVTEGEEDITQASIREQLVLVSLPKSRIKLVAGEIPITEGWPGYKGLILPTLVKNTALEEIRTNNETTACSQFSD